MRELVRAAGGATIRSPMLLLPLLACLAAGPLTGTLAGEPPVHVSSESLLLNVHNLPTTSAAPEQTTPPATTASGVTAPPPTAVPAVPADTAGTGGERSGGREGGSRVETVSSDADDAGVDAPETDPPADSENPTERPTDSEAAKAAAGTGEKSGDDATFTTTAAPDDDTIPTTAVTEEDEVTTLATTTASDEHPTAGATEPTSVPSGEAPTAPPGAEPSTTPGGQEPTPAIPGTPATDGTGPEELPVRLVGGVALKPSRQPTLSRHRADPGLAPSETKPSRARTGVLDPEMLDNPSKPRKGAPPPDELAVAPSAAFSGGLSVTEGTPITESVTASQATVTSAGSGFFGENALPGPSLTEKPTDQADETTPKPKLAEASDAAGGSSGVPRASTVAGVVVLVLLFAAIGFFVFRKVREHWYRRHYRKMDFLVDGMYNL